MIRTFISISIPENIRQAIAGYQESMSGMINSIRWTKPENIHITLKFIGEIREELVDRIIKNVMDQPPYLGSFDLEISGAGVFPNIKRPRIYWIGITSGQKQLSRLASDLEDRLEPLGIAREKRPFKPHITIGRAKKGSPVSGLKENIESEVLSPLSFHVDRIHLMKSVLKPSGAEYSSLAYHSLR